MQFVYILKSEKNNQLYIGCTHDLTQRLQEHNKGLVRSTSRHIPWQIVYYEAYLSGKEAYHREHNLKLRSNAWNQLKARITDSITLEYANDSKGKLGVGVK